jgi:hypothetical protein
MPADAIELPAPAAMAAAAGASAWCIAGARLLGFDADGQARLDVPAPEAVTSLAAADDLVATLAPGIVTWLDPESGAELARRPLGGEPVACQGDGRVWIFDATAGRAWPVRDVGALGEPTSVPDASAVAPVGDALWWLVADGSELRVGSRRVELDASLVRGRAGPPPLAGCAGAVFVGGGGYLTLVSARDPGVVGRVAVPGARIGALCCASGVLVAEVDGHVYALDPQRDEELRRLALEVEGGVGHLVAAGSVVWAFSATAPRGYRVSLDAR